MNYPDENTVGRTEARQALAESQQSSRAADSVVADNVALFEQMRAARNDDRFTQKLRDIIHGKATA